MTCLRLACADSALSRNLVFDAARSAFRHLGRLSATGSKHSQTSALRRKWALVAKHTLPATLPTSQPTSFCSPSTRSPSLSPSSLFYTSFERFARNTSCLLAVVRPPRLNPSLTPNAAILRSDSSSRLLLRLVPTSISTCERYAVIGFNGVSRVPCAYVRGLCSVLQSRHTGERSPVVEQRRESRNMGEEPIGWGHTCGYRARKTEHGRAHLRGKRQYVSSLLLRPFLPSAPLG